MGLVLWSWFDGEVEYSIFGNLIDLYLFLLFLMGYACAGVFQGLF